MLQETRTSRVNYMDGETSFSYAVRETASLGKYSRYCYGVSLSTIVLYMYATCTVYVYILMYM